MLQIIVIQLACIIYLLAFVASENISISKEWEGFSLRSLFRFFFLAVATAGIAASFYQASAIQNSINQIRQVLP